MTFASRSPGLAIPDRDLGLLRRGEHDRPHDVLGLHHVDASGERRLVLRAFHPDAEVACAFDAEGRSIPLARVQPGLFATLLPPGGAADSEAALAPDVEFRFAGGARWRRGDPYRYAPTVGELDCHLFAEGTHEQLWRVLGANVRLVAGAQGVSFAVWAPRARSVALVGDFCAWDGRLLPMRRLGDSGIFEIFLPGLGPGALYKFEIRTREGEMRLKSDPFARAAEGHPGHASIVEQRAFRWSDESWLAALAKRDPRRAPIAIYEAHLGSWRRSPGQSTPRYREIAGDLADHALRHGFTHVELLPVTEHPYDGSWGYQVTGFFAPTHRFGPPDDLRAFVDACHARGLGVILDWVPAHFPRDDFALRRFDGRALFEHDDPRRGEHPDWGTLIFDYDRPEVRNFLLASALYWLDEFHFDALRVDAVASMLYLNYSRAPGEWLPNVHGGVENLGAAQLLRETNRAVARLYPGRFTIAEESTAWPGITAPVEAGGLGFTFKWNMGWMHDTLRYFARDPVHRRFHQHDLTFAMVYEHSERFINALSHDEVVHGKGSLLARMPGDRWQAFANLRTLYAYQWTRPGKVLLFMGGEFGTPSEWDHQGSLPWSLAEQLPHAALGEYLAALGQLYRTRPELWRGDPDPAGFEWIATDDAENSVIAYLRRSGEALSVIVLNLTPTPRQGYRLGLPRGGRYERLLSSDDERFGGSGWSTPAFVDAEESSYHGRPWSGTLALPPLAALVLAAAEDE